MSGPFVSLVLRDLRLASRSGGSAALALAFFALVATLVPLGVGANLNLLARIAGGVRDAYRRGSIHAGRLRVLPVGHLVSFARAIGPFARRKYRGTEGQLQAKPDIRVLG